MKNILELLENSAQRTPEKLAFADEAKSMTYAQLLESCRSFGTGVAKQLEGKTGNGVALLLERSVGCICAMFGTAYSGNWYVVMDSHSPQARLQSILDTVEPAALVFDAKNAEMASNLKKPGSCLTLPLSTLEQEKIDEEILAEIRASMIDTDPLYALFTSGSTGVPKGAILTHRNVLSYTEWFVRCFHINEQTVFGSQTPLYFSMSVSDVFATISSGAALQLIPQQLFSFPMPLLEFLQKRHVNTIYWVPSALGIIAQWKALDYTTLPELRMVLFAGEVMPVKYLNYWREKCKNACFANLFGPTETTDICAYYVVDRDFSDTQTLPIGRACDNCDIFAVAPDAHRCAAGEEGELYVRGSFLSAGYYNNPEKTAGAFVQNPFNHAYPEMVYRTGDLVRRNERGEYEYLCRKDAQIKRAGYRIELGEIEAAAGAMPGIERCAAIYDGGTDRLVLLYSGRRVEEAKCAQWMREHVPAYMQPDWYLPLKAMPYNANGKIDRRYLQEHYQEYKK